MSAHALCAELLATGATPELVRERMSGRWWELARSVRDAEPPASHTARSAALALATRLRPALRPFETFAEIASAAVDYAMSARAIISALVGELGSAEEALGWYVCLSGIGEREPWEKLEDAYREAAASQARAWIAQLSPLTLSAAIELLVLFFPHAYKGIRAARAEAEVLSHPLTRASLEGATLLGEDVGGGEARQMNSIMGSAATREPFSYLLTLGERSLCNRVRRALGKRARFAAYTALHGMVLEVGASFPLSPSQRERFRELYPIVRFRWRPWN